MTREEKKQVIDGLTESLSNPGAVYLADYAGMTVEVTHKLRKECFDKNITMLVVKNTLLQKAMEASGKDFSPLYAQLHGATAVLLSENNNSPAKLIKGFQKTSDKLQLKGAYVEESCYVGAEQLDVLVNLKSREELIADVVALLQSPMKNVISALNGNAGQKIAGLVKTLEERGA